MQWQVHAKHNWYLITSPTRPPKVTQLFSKISIAGIKDQAYTFFFYRNSNKLAISRNQCSTKELVVFFKFSDGWRTGCVRFCFLSIFYIHYQWEPGLEHNFAKVWKTAIIVYLTKSLFVLEINFWNCLFLILNFWYHLPSSKVFFLLSNNRVHLTLNILQYYKLWIRCKNIDHVRCCSRNITITIRNFMI